MTVTVPKIRNAAAMDVDINVWFHIKVFIAYLMLVYYISFFINAWSHSAFSDWSLCHMFV